MTAQFATSKFIRNYVLCFAVCLMTCSMSLGQAPPPGGGGGGLGNGFFFPTVVGGVSIDANGVLNDESAELTSSLRQQLLDGLNATDADIHKKTKLRVVSLKGLEAAMNEAARTGKRLSADVEFMAGLQRIEYVMLDPENNDVLIGGPGEGWTIDRKGNVVGKTTGMPVIHLEDFLVAMRNVEEANQGQGISVSIDPTENGIKRLHKLYRSVKVGPHMKQTIEETVGPQQITLTGIPKNSRFSQVLVAADYKMKRLSMGLEEAPIADMPSVIEMARRKNASFKNSSPRFWMECNYQPVAKSPDNTIWQIRGQGVRALTEDSFFDANGESVRKQGKTNKFAKSWAESMTARYDELSQQEPVFRDLRNLMDLSVVAAIIAREDLLEKVGLDIPTIASKQSYVSVPSLNVPKSVPSQCGFVQFRNSWVVSVSGGVQVDSWAVAANTQEVASVSKIRENAVTPTAERWWWNSTN